MKVFKYLFITFFIFMFFSCDSFLTENPESSIAVDNFFQTNDDAIAAVNSAYDPLNHWFTMFPRGLYLLGELPTDNAERGQGVVNPNIVQIEEFTLNPTNDRVELLYQNFYVAINRANLAIAKIPNMEIEENLKQRLVGEARFLRALSYYVLVRFLGPVPLVTEPTTSLNDINPPRAPIDEVYSQIISDLEFGQQNLLNPPETEAGRPPNTAATGLLASVHLTRENWELAVQNAENVINSGFHKLLNDYEAVFRPATEDSEEIIFAIQFDSGIGGEAFNLRGSFPQNGVPGVVGWGADLPREEFYQSFEDEDSRKSVTFFTEIEREGETYTFPGPRWFKFFDPAKFQAGQSDVDSDFPVLRYAEILLILAEAENEINGPTPRAYEAINQVRGRAYGDDSHNLSSLSQDEFRKAVWKERRLEFGKENKRWFDLKRQDRLIEVNRAIGYENIQDFHRRYPIPQKEMDRNPNLEQNPGY